ncbi:MAG: hypothetical protein KBT34_05390 [Prevotella sp.]|nr:hypothetical protein [Candidatus Prevotella equi]
MKERRRADIDIINPQGELIETVLITPQANRVVKLMDSDYITLKFSLADAKFFPVGSYCDDEIFGRFYVTQEQMPKYNTTTGGYDYELRMDAWYHMWNLKQFMLIGELPNDAITKTYFRRETNWYHTNSLREQMRQFMRNLQVLGFVGADYNFLLDGDGNDLDKFIDIDKANVKKYSLALLMSYNGIHMIDALRELANTWECEYWITGNEDAFVIHFGKCENGTEETLSLDTNVESMDINNDVSDSADRIYYYGGIENIPNTYRKVIELYACDVEGTTKVERFHAKKNLSDTKPARIKWAMLHNPEHSEDVNTEFEIVFDHDEDVPTQTLPFGNNHKPIEQVVYDYFEKTYSTLPAYKNKLILHQVSEDMKNNRPIFFTMMVKFYDEGELVELEITRQNVSSLFGGDDITNIVSLRIYAHYNNGDPVSLDYGEWEAYIHQIGATIDKTDLFYDDVNGWYYEAMIGDITIRLYTYVSTNYIEFYDVEGSSSYEQFYALFEDYEYLYKNTLLFERLEFDDTWAQKYQLPENYIGYPFFRCWYIDKYQIYNIFKGSGSKDAISVVYDQWDYTLRTNTIEIERPQKTLHCLSDVLSNKMFGADAIRLIVPKQIFKLGLWSTHPIDTLDNTKIAIGFISGHYSWHKYTYDTPEVQPLREWRTYGETRTGCTGLVVDVAVESIGVSEKRCGHYYTEVEYKAMEKQTPINFAFYGEEGIYAGMTMDLPNTTYQVDFITPIQFDLTTFETGVYKGYMGKDDYFHFIPQTTPMKSSFPNGKKFRIYADYCYKVPYAYWLNELDDPASLLSIGDLRLQLPTYRRKPIDDYNRNVLWKYIPEEDQQRHFSSETGELDEWTYKDGWFYNEKYKVYFHDGYVYDYSKEVACKDGYIIFTDMIGHEKNVRELTITDDTIYPDGRLLIKEIHTKDCKTDNDVEGESVDVEWLWQQYHLRVCRPIDRSKDFPFNLDFILPNSQPLKVRFLVPEDMIGQEGITEEDYKRMQAQCKMSGMQFEVEFNNKIRYKDSGATTATDHLMDYAIKRNDDFGAMLPNDILHPQVGDPCVLVNWNVKALENLGLIDEAEFKLFNKAAEYLRTLREGNFTFTCNMMSDFFFDFVKYIPLYEVEEKALYESNNYRLYVKNGYDVYVIPPLGQKVLIKHKALKADKHTRVIGYEFKLDKPYDTPKMICGDTEAYSRLKQLEKNITKLSK